MSEVATVEVEEVVLGPLKVRNSTFCCPKCGSESLRYVSNYSKRMTCRECKAFFWRMEAFDSQAR